ncbi:MAG: AAA family ATPase [Nevskiales bacterium]|nr:AAA family ATPase [Nevskiales bacterium]
MSVPESSVDAAAAALPPLLRPLLGKQAYPHPVSAITLLQTHISWVLLTGNYVYKIKKPVDFGFLDFSTLERRREACEAELRLNHRLAPELYLGLVQVIRSDGGARIGDVDAAGAEVVEYAVRMRQFGQDAQLDRVLECGALEPAALLQLAADIARFHLDAPAAPADSGFGSDQAVWQPVEDNFGVLEAAAATPHQRAQIAAVRQWCRACFRALRGRLEDRRRHGWIREGHGDLHLANLVLIEGRIRAFDCIEFSADLRWIDVISDVAFLMMDLAHRGRGDLAYRFINRYLEVTGDYAGIDLLDFYRVYRALVRAKVAVLQARTSSGLERRALMSAAQTHLDLAQSWTLPSQPRLLLMHGLSGSGKSRVSAEVSALLPAIRLRSDVERKRLYGLAAEARSGSALDHGIYESDSSERTYARLADLARELLRSGHSVVVDATFLRRADRERFGVLAAELGVPLHILACSAPDDELRRRVRKRAEKGADASEAGVEVLERQFATVEPPAADEAALVIPLATDLPGAARPDVCAALAAHGLVCRYRRFRTATAGAGSAPRPASASPSR